MSDDHRILISETTDGSGKSATCVVAVIPNILICGVSVIPPYLTLELGEEADLTATVYPENAVDKRLSWTAVDNNILTMSQRNEDGDPTAQTIGHVYAKNLGESYVYATAEDGSGVYGACYVTVVPVPVESVTIEEPTKEIQAGSRYQMSATILPVDATIQDLKWCSSNETVAKIDENTGMLTGVSAGEVTITAVAQDYCEVSGSREVEIIPRVVGESVTLNRTSVTLSPGETFRLTAEVLPVNTLYKTVTWSSYPGYVASVSQEGLITAKVAGTTTITASTADGISATCVVTVDNREKVTVKKDSHSFYVKFADGKVWKSIGIDLSNREENYNQLNPPHMWYEYYDDLIEEEQRYFDNIYVEENGVIVNNSYSEKQLGFLYLLDPLGIEYYMRHNACQDMSLGATLFFKDRVYKEIFGVWPRLIKVFPDKTIQYYVYPSSISADTRADYYTDAEILFGEHPIYDILSLISFLLDVVPSVSLSLFSMFYPPVGVVLSGIELVKFLFFSASASGVLSSGTSSIMEEYTTNIYTLSGGESAGEKAGKAMGWVNFVLGTFSTILDAAEVFTPSINDITTYNRINASDYRVNYNVSGSELSMADIISRIS